MAGDRPPGKIGAWAWPVVFVTALHLLSTAGTWWITDHGEILAVADHFMSTGHLNLDGLGPGWETWTRMASVRGSTETRFLPLSILPLVPFLSIDHLFGLPPSAFRVVHLEGHFFVTLGLLLIGRWLSKAGATPQTIALSVVLLGLNWPVWMVARRLGPEPVLFFMVAAFAVGRRSARIAVLLLLPWVHASGSLLGLGLVGWSWLEPRINPGLSARSALLAWAFGAASVVLFWNIPHGHALWGGYASYRSDAFFKTQNPFLGSLGLWLPFAAWTLPVWLLAAKRGKEGLPALLALWLPSVLFFGTFSSHEPERRLMPLLAATMISVVMIAGSSIEGRPAAGLFLLVSLGSGIVGLTSDFVDTVATPFGLYSGPILALLRLAFADRHPLGAAILALLLSSIAGFAGVRTWRLAFDVRPQRT